jgi:hypothetical protein
MLQTSTEEILPPMFKPQVSGFHVQSGYFEPVITRIGTFGGKEGLGSGATAVVLVDVSFATAAHWDRLREAALAFIDTMGEEDEVAILFVGQTFVTSGMRRYDERNVLREFVARTLPDAVVEQSPAIRDSGVDASLWPEKLLTPVGLDPKGNELFDVLERYALPLAVSSDSELPSLILFSGGRNFGNAAALSLEAVEQLAKAARNQRVRVFALGQMEVDSEGTVQNRSELALLQKLCDETLGVYQETAYFTEPSTLFPGAKEMLVDRLVVVDVEFRGIPENVGELSATNYLTLRYRDEEAGIDVESMSWKVPTLGAKREATTASARVDTTVRIGAPRGEDEDRAGVGDDEHTRNGACSKLDALNEELEAIDSLSVSECRIWRSRVAEYRPPACRRADGQTRYRAFVQLVGTLCRHAHEKACGIQVKELDKVWNRGPRPNCSVMKTQLDVLTHDACNLHELKTRNGVPTGVIGMLRSLEQSIRKDCGIDEEVMPQSKAEEGMKADEARPKTETVAGERADDWPEESFEMPPTSVATDFCRNANASALQCACYISCSKALKDAFGKAEESIEAGIHPEGCYSLFDKSSAVWKVCRQDADCLSFEETASLWHQFLRVMKYKCYKAVGTEPKSVGFN